eukprot:SM000023S07654  [mRNA]  locus=s23:630680:632702:- [translate_table: standard]
MTRQQQREANLRKQVGQVLYQLAKAPEDGESSLPEVVRRAGRRWGPQVPVTALRELLRRGNWACAMQEGCSPDLTTFNGLIEAYGKHAQYDKVESVMQHLLRYKYRPRALTYNLVIDAYAKGGLIKEMEAACERMRMERKAPTAFTLSSMISAYKAAGLHAKMTTAINQFHKLELQPDAKHIDAIGAADRTSQDVDKRAGRPSSDASGRLH